MTTYSWANQSRRYDSSFPTQRYTGGPNKGLLHTTETTTLPGYAGGGQAPHLTGVPDFANKRIDWYQHFDSDRPSRALADQAGGVQTNNDGVFQVELVGSCTRAYVDKYGGMFWPEAPEWALEEVRLMMRRVGEDRGIPFTADVEWLPYPASYGSTSVRMSQPRWDGYAGWCGHQHAPENDHGDPGDLSALFQEDPFMAIDLDAFAKKIANLTVFNTEFQIIGRPEGEKMSLATAARVTYDRAGLALKALDGHDVRLAALEQGQKDLAAAVAAIDSDLDIDLPTKEEYLAVAREEFRAKADQARVVFEDSTPDPAQPTA